MVRGFTRKYGLLTLLSVASLCASLLRLPSLSAQDNWSITREKQPHSKPARAREGKVAPVRTSRGTAPTRAVPSAQAQPSELVERTYRAFVSVPEDGFALRRLRELWLLGHGSLDSLVARLRTEQAANAARVEPALALAHVLVLTDQRADALAVLAPFLADSRAALLQARLLRDSGRVPEAEQTYLTLSKSARAAADRQAALNALAELALEAGDTELARTRYAELARAGGAGGDQAGTFARALAQRGSHAQAAQEFLNAAQARRGDVRAVVPLLREAAQAQLAAGDASGAKASLERALSLAGADSGLRGTLYDLLIEAARQSDGLRALAEQLSRDGRGGLDAAARAAKLWDELGDETRAVEAYRALLRRSPRDLDARRALSQLLLRAGRLDEVIVEQRELVRLSPDEPAFVVGLAELLKQVGRASEAERILHDASQRASQSIPLHRALSELYARWGDAARAEAELSQLAKLDPDDPVHLVALGSERFERGDRAGALAVWKRLLEQAGHETAEGHAALSAVLADHDWLDLAIEHAQKAAVLEPRSVDAQRALASLFERAGRFPEAESSWHATIKLAVHDPATRREGRQHLVGLWSRFGTLKRHQIDLDDRIQREPSDLEAARLLAEAHAHDVGPLALRAEQLVLEKIVIQAPSDLESLRALERSYMRAGDKVQALNALERLIAADPAHAADALRRAVELSLASYRDADALRFAQRAVQVSPDDARAHRLLGDLHRGLRDLDAAQVAYTRALALSPRDFQTTLLLAQVETARGKLESAEKALISVLQGSPDDELLSRAARALVQLDVSRSHLERVEPALLALALQHPERPLHRKQLIELYSVWLTPLAQRVSDERASVEERELLARVGRRALKPLLEALLDDDPLQRGVALDLLGVMANENAAGPLLSLAEQSTDTAERARALIAVGMLSDGRVGARLKTLTSRAEGRLRPVAVWALLRCEGERAHDALLAMATDEDAGVRVIATLGLGMLRSTAAESVLRSLLNERHASVRAAALWALSRSTHDSGLSQRALDWPAPAWQVATYADHDAVVLTRALLSAQSEQRAYAAQRLARNASRPLPRLPPPSWPFVPKSYVLQVAEAGAALAALSPAQSEALVSAFPAALQEALADPKRRYVALSALTQSPGRLSLGGLEGALDCAPRQAALDKLVTLQAALTDIATRGSPQERELAVTALARMGAPGLDSPVLLTLISGPPSSLRGALLDALAELPGRATAMKTQLRNLAESAPDWPTRLRARRALEPSVAASLRPDPVALVGAESAPASAASASSSRCPPSALN